MTCQQCRNAVSARLDGEETGIDAEALDWHLDTCRACRRFATRVQVLGQMVPTPQEQVPDRSAEILTAVRSQRSPHPRMATEQVARGGLAVVGLVQVVAALVGVALGTVPHSLRDLGAFQIALAIGFLVAALRPSTAPGLLPTAAALALCLLAVVGVDIVGGQTAIPREVAHATELIGVALVWLIARDQPAPRVQRA